MKKLLLLTLLFLMFLPVFYGEGGQDTDTDGLPDLIPYRKGDKWGFCDKDKNIVIECKYDRVELFSEGLATVSINGKWGVIDEEGKLIVDCTYDFIRPFSEGG